MSVLYNSTRGGEKDLKASEAIIKGLSEDGGLFFPSEIPTLDIELSDLQNLDYRETAYKVMKGFLSDFTEEELRNCIDNAYDSKFDNDEIAPLVKKGDEYFLELFHGKTIAFKDMALSILPHLLVTSLKKNGIDKEVVILTATSGDTGKAALAGFADVPGTRIIVFYPKGGVSRVQELQMVTQKGTNTTVIGVKGNFDDCQSGVKAIFSNKELKSLMADNGYCFSSANSINIGRLVPQVAYYVFAYGRMIKNGAIKAGDKINFVVPTGNFGNILAGYFAKLMGIPVGKFICASNDNKVLYDFFETGIYDKNREFILTSSPSMDILISSNLERLIYLIAGKDADKNSELMSKLSMAGKYEITEEMKEKLSDFIGMYADEDLVDATIKKIYDASGYVIDTHTAVATAADLAYKEKSGDDTKSVIVSTASPFKFSRSVMNAINGEVENADDFEIIDELSKISGVDEPGAILEIRSADILHDTVCEIEEMEKLVKANMGL